MKVLITRPSGQEHSLVQLLEGQSIAYDHLPLLSIAPKATEQADKELIMNLDQFTGVIVVSPNAARHGLDLIEQYWPQFPARQYWLTNGYGTAKVLEHAGLEVAFPETGTRTEDLLELPELDQIIGQKWLIIKGEGGRDLLKQELEDRGAEVSVLSVYKRSAPEITKAEAAKALADVDTLILTSGEALDNLNKLADIEQLKDKTFIVSSSRMAQMVQERGLTDIVVAKGASDALILQALLKLDEPGTDGQEE
ncbi:uroporphyrinogen-III synthase [Gynuella sunshinyii]|uniref:uroporphyrinogen-III synthase n=1 Tax=Gynuella sunshinyii TaxID=1445505 RepID=UPI0005CBFED6|nr:uroporphyrinogen-III synthase [Gynuella sunshinyii]